MDFLKERKPGDGPWCLTVGFVNPHDKEFFPAGTEFLTVSNLFNGHKYNPDGLAQFIDFKAGPPKYPWGRNPLKSPPSFGYPTTPPNWESADQIARNKPSTQTFARLFQEAVWGGVSDDSGATDFSIVEYPTNPNFKPFVPPFGVAKAPYSYWQRSLDCYTQIMTILDDNIGSVLDALPRQVADNTVIVFTSDHGEYAGAHGFVSGKAGTCYEEVFNVPLIVFDPTGRFTGDIPTIRTGLSSSVDVLRMLVSLGHNGSQSWLTGDLAAIYGQRLNLLPMLQSAGAPGRPYVVFTTDEPTPTVYNFNNSPGHVIGLRTPDAKLGVYADWVTGTTDIKLDSIQLEYYDYQTSDGRLETDNRKNDPAAFALLNALLTNVLPNELRAPLPSTFIPAQTIAKTRYLTYVGPSTSSMHPICPYRSAISDVFAADTLRAMTEHDQVAIEGTRWKLGHRPHAALSPRPRVVPAVGLPPARHSSGRWGRRRKRSRAPGSGWVAASEPGTRFGEMTTRVMTRPAGACGKLSAITAVQVSGAPADGTCILLGYWTRSGPGRDEVPGFCCPD